MSVFLQCSRTTSLDVFFKDTDSNPVAKIAVIGCGCSPATEPVAEISHHWNISQVGFSNKNRLFAIAKIANRFCKTILCLGKRGFSVVWEGKRAAMVLAIMQTSLRIMFPPTLVCRPV